jgi:uncharacterized protein YodC (DUF2158 family)
MITIMREHGQPKIYPNAVSVFTSLYSYGEEVRADNGDVVMFVTGFMFTTLGCQVECSWFANGSHYQVWFYEWRLTKKEE